MASIPATLSGNLSIPTPPRANTRRRCATFTSRIRPSTGGWREGIDGDGWWRYTPPGWGELNWATLLAELQRVEYAGCLSIEHEDAVWDRNEAILQSLLLSKALPGVPGRPGRRARGRNRRARQSGRRQADLGGASCEGEGRLTPLRRRLFGPHKIPHPSSFVILSFSLIQGQPDDLLNPHRLHRRRTHG